MALSKTFYVLAGLAGLILIAQEFEICDSLFRNPIIFTFLAFFLHNRFSVERRMKFYNIWAKWTTIVCFIWFVWDRYINENRITSIGQRFIDFLIAVIQTIVVSQNCDIGKLLMNPTYLFLDIFCSKQMVLLQDETDMAEIMLWLTTIFELSISFWTKDHFFIDGVIDISTPLALYSSTMVTIMYLNILPYFRDTYYYDSFGKLIMIALSFYNLTFTLGIFFIYTLT